MKFPDKNIDLKIKTIFGKDNHSHAIVKWQTNMEKKFYIHQGHTAVSDLFDLIRMYNFVCVNQRDRDGEDDEPEDETKLLN